MSAPGVHRLAAGTVGGDGRTRRYAPGRDGDPRSVPTGVDEPIGVQLVVAASHHAGAAWTVPDSPLERTEV